PDPLQVELRYYNMTDKLAGELQGIIPRLVAVDAWAKLPDGTSPLIEKISVGDQPPTGLGSQAGGLGGGGGFFQMGGLGGTSAAPTTESLLAKIAEKLERAEQPAPVAKAILAVRQTRRVHGEIDRFLRDLAEKAWPAQFGSFPSGGVFSGGMGGGGLGGMPAGDPGR
ncbi:MAG TPA: hypothetical protein VM452_14745, partial [Caulifigura sp.]|nr:hypothetical protein [Caulifigura sp.]